MQSRAGFFFFIIFLKTCLNLPLFSFFFFFYSVACYMVLWCGGFLFFCTCVNAIETGYLFKSDCSSLGWKERKSGERKDGGIRFFWFDNLCVIVICNHILIDCCSHCACSYSWYFILFLFENILVIQSGEILNILQFCKALCQPERWVEFHTFCGDLLV